jgi:hypothetical protein
MTTTTSNARWRVSIASLAALASLAAAILAATGSPAAGAPVKGAPVKVEAELRIEGPKGNLVPGRTYSTGTERVKRSKGLGCKHRDGKIKVEGPTALGIAETASDESRKLPPVRVRPDDFGLFVCEIGGLIGRPFDDPEGFSGWTYWVNYAGGTQAAELETLSDGDQVLWVFSDFGEKNINTGDALELTGVPTTDADGEFTVEVVGHAFNGSPTPLAGAKIKGAEDVEDLGGGEYAVTVGNGRSTLYAKHKPDIPSNQEKVVVG